MKVHVYTNQECIPGKKLRKVLQETITQVHKSFSETCDEFLEQLRHPLAETRIIGIMQITSFPRPSHCVCGDNVQNSLYQKNPIFPIDTIPNQEQNGYIAIKKLIRCAVFGI